MNEQMDRLEKNMNDLIEIVVAIKDNMVTKQEFEEFKEDTEKNFEMVTGKVEGVQRGLDSNFERHSALEARVSKIEVELHPKSV